MLAWDESMSYDEPLAEIIAANSVGRKIDPSKLLAFLRPIFERSQHSPRLTPPQLSAYEDLSRDERDVLIRCLQVLQEEVSKTCSQLPRDTD